MLLETKDLTKIYRRGEKEFRAVDKASISVEKGELAVITGPSGCGKSTLFHLISGITVPDSGLVLFEGDEITGISPQAAARLRAEKISYILQGNSLLANLTVLENICLPHRLYGCGIDVEERAIRLLEEFGLEGMAEEYPGNLSGGERRRAAIVRAFVHEPLLVVADEPTSDLDEENTKIILDYFERKRKAGTAILISTHDLSCLRPGVTHYRMDHGVIRSRTEI